MLYLLLRHSRSVKAPQAVMSPPSFHLVISSQTLLRKIIPYHILNILPALCLITSVISQQVSGFKIQRPDISVRHLESKSLSGVHGAKLCLLPDDKLLQSLHTGIDGSCIGNLPFIMSLPLLTVGKCYGNTFVASADGSLQLGPDWEELKK